ncbi:hypothetical protein J1605_006799 [Eschrichtius robustus]|uniref:Uncharacterized protein n=1 Tax=Eschrichtius robustus TaxID=9764 RepID=A0AB34H555_ESCRO|nr:hypothetical protein J1605_006799 [Eschrichtius robustus]
MRVGVEKVSDVLRQESLLKEWTLFWIASVGTTLEKVSAFSNHWEPTFYMVSTKQKQGTWSATGSTARSSNMVTGETKSFFSFAKSGVAMSHQSLPSSSLLSASSAASEALTDSLALQAPSEHLLFVVLCQAPGYHSE